MSNEVLQQMDRAAEQAELELRKIIDDGVAKDVAVWVAKWYMQAGYKRLGKILVAIGKAASK